MCTKNDTELKACLKFLKTSFFVGKRPYFSLQNCPGDWDRIYRHSDVNRLDCVPANAVFLLQIASKCWHCQQYRGSFRSFQDLQWERTSRRKNRAVLGLIKPDNNEHLRCLLFFRTVWRMLLSSRRFILTVHQWKHLSCEISFLSSFRVYREHQSPCVHINSLLFPST